MPTGFPIVLKYLYLDITFDNGVRVKSIQLHVIDDDIPELTESFQLTINSIQLQGLDVDFDRYVSGIQINTPPLLLQKTVNITINENDDPYGVVEFTQNEVSVSEGDGDLMIPLIRKGEIMK